MTVHKWSRCTLATIQSIQQKHKSTCELLILIDGNDKQTIDNIRHVYDTRDMTSNISINVYHPGQHLFLTKLWNAGLQTTLTKYNNVLVINDDVLFSDGFDVAICEELKDHLVVCPKYTEGSQPFATKAKEKRGNISGRCRAIKKNDRPLIGPIDERIALRYNDDRIYRKLTDMKQVPHWSNKVFCHHYRSQTVDNPDLKAIVTKQIEQDQEHRKTILHEQGRYDERFAR